MIQQQNAIRKNELVPIEMVSLDRSTQMRVVQIDPLTVEEYAAEMTGGAEFPPVTLFFDGETYYIGDGFHRVEGARKAERTQILADVRQGNQRDAMLYAMGANSSHGLRRTQDDKRNAVETILKDPDWSKWSARQIAEVCDVSHSFVNKVRRKLTGGNVSSTRKSGNVSTRTTKVETFPPDENGNVSTQIAASLSDDVLIAECQRRGLEVSR